MTQSEAVAELKGLAYHAFHIVIVCQLVLVLGLDDREPNQEAGPLMQVLRAQLKFFEESHYRFEGLFHQLLGLAATGCCEHDLMFEILRVN